MHGIVEMVIFFCGEMFILALMEGVSNFSITVRGKDLTVGSPLVKQTFQR